MCQLNGLEPKLKIQLTNAVVSTMVVSDGALDWLDSIPRRDLGNAERELVEDVMLCLQHYLEVYPWIRSM